MNLLRSRFLTGLALTSLLPSILAAQPTARVFSSAFVFGDSLSDTGNLFAVAGTPPAPYFNGRFSNGPVYAELLFPGLQNTITAPGSVKTNLNFAFAGATAVGSTPIPASLPVQLGMFQARGITAGANDIFVVLAGANDVLNGIANPATQNDPAITSIARTAAASVATSVQSLAASGARNLLVINLPNIAQTPRFTTGSGAAANSLAQSGSLAFNAALRGTLGAATLPAGTNVTVVDLQSFLNTIVRNPSVFGFTITNLSIVDILTAGGNPGNFGDYIFFDSIHPTTKTHAILAETLREILNPEFVLGTAGAQGTAVIAMADMTADTVDSRLDQVRHGANHHAADGYVSYNYQKGGRNFNSYQPGFDFTGQVLTAGIDYQLSPALIVGLAFSQETTSATVKSGLGNGSFKLTGEVGTAYAQWKSGATFAEATATYGAQDLRDISRPTSLGGFRTMGQNSGERYGGSLKVGRDFAGEKFHLTPFVGLRYLRGTVDRYDESGVTGLNFSFGQQDLKTFGGQVGANFSVPINFGETQVHLGLSGVYSKDLVNSTRRLSGRLVDNLSLDSNVLVEDGNGDSFKLGCRVSGKAGKRWMWTAGLGNEMRSDGKDAVQYSASIQTGF